MTMTMTMTTTTTKTKTKNTNRSHTIRIPAHLGLSYRDRDTARDLLRSHHDLVHRELLTKGLKWSAALDVLATRAVQAEARKILGKRHGRRTERLAGERARAGQPGRIIEMIPVYAQRRAEAAAARKAKRVGKALAGERLGRAAIDEILPSLIHRVSGQADQVIRCVVRAVGVIGEQCRADLAQIETNRDGSIGKRHGKEVETTLHRVEHTADWSAALITLQVHSHYYSRNGIGGSDRRHCGSDKYECWLCVRDSSRSEAHLLRVPPKFGNAATDFFRTFPAPKQRIQAAVAWTFDRAAAEYAPEVEA